MSGTDRPDAVLVGAGINSLGAAFLLGRAGWRVLVVERNDEPGGAIRTMELTLPGFRHDIGAMNLNLFASSPFLEQHRDLPGKERLRAGHRGPFGRLGIRRRSVPRDHHRRRLEPALHRSVLEA